MRSLCTMRKWKLWALCFIWVFSSSCSILLINPKKPDCTSSPLAYAIPVFGTMATLSAATAALLFTADGKMNTPGAFFTGLTIVGVVSTIYGFKSIYECRLWKEEQRARGAMNLNLNSCGGLYPGLPPGMTFAPEPHIPGSIKANAP